jgi:putative SOS response-associated peptidase YedK
MCGRFTQAYTGQELVALYRLTVPAINLQPRYNIAPTTMIDVIVPSGIAFSISSGDSADWWSSGRLFCSSHWGRIRSQPKPMW